jgi:hypothetical protein
VVRAIRENKVGGNSDEDGRDAPCGQQRSANKPGPGGGAIAYSMIKIQRHLFVDERANQTRKYPLTRSYREALPFCR